MKIVTVLGARPQFIKAGSVSREILDRRKQGIDIEEVIIHTGQHYDTNMSDIFFDEMKIPKANYSLGIGGTSHGSMTGQMLEKIEEILIKEKPDWVIVYGDTNSTLAGSLAASKLNIKIAHIEAGLRSFNMEMPEEVNRILTDRISTLLLCPTQIAMDNLKNEGIADWKTGAKAVRVGDVMHDGALYYKKFAVKPSDIALKSDFILCTIHRAENTDNPANLRSITRALNEIGKSTQVLLPLHPRTKKVLQESGYDISNLTVINPVGYLNMVWLLEHCSIVMTDSGGLQKEAFFFDKPCLTLREQTEWVELVDLGVNLLVGNKFENILSGVESALTMDISNIKPNMYGEGKASANSVSELLGFG